MFEEKYNKYKYKYFSLKELINQKGQGMPPFKVLIFGGGNPELYGQGFYEVGFHPTSNFGAGKDWHDPRFWSDLDNELKNMTFDVIMIDDGSGSWLSEKCMIPIITLIITRLVKGGIFILEGPHVRDNDDNIHDITIMIRKEIKNIGFNTVGRIGCGGVYDNRIYTLYSLDQGEILQKIDKSGINEDILPGPWNPQGFIDRNPNFKYVKELNQREFVKNRFLTILP